MSGAVGSMPSLARSGRPSSAAARRRSSSPPAGSDSTAFRSRNCAVSAAAGGEFRKAAMLVCLRRAEPPEGARRHRAPQQPFTAPRRSAPCPLAPAPIAAGLQMADDHSDRPGAGTGVESPQRATGATVTPFRSRPRVNRYRLALVLGGLCILAIVSTVFGMMMAVAQDLPSLESQNEFKAARNSVLVDDRGRSLATLTGQENRILLRSNQISSNVKRAVIAIEDQRFYQHKGVDYRGIMRAIWEDVRRQRAAQGASTITQQFVKNALVAQKNRSVFQKLREAALAYQLERKWSKEKILTEYLNTVYFGEGAYGIESAARVFFGWNHPGCEPECAQVLEPAEAALLAGQIASPAAYSPVQNPASALARRNLVLGRMQDQAFITMSEYRDAVRESLPPRSEVAAPRKVS